MKFYFPNRYRSNDSKENIHTSQKCSCAIQICKKCHNKTLHIVGIEVTDWNDYPILICEVCDITVIEKVGKLYANRDKILSSEELLEKAILETFNQ